MSRSVLAATVLLASVAIAGCSSAPETFTVTGTVVMPIPDDQVFTGLEVEGQGPVPKTECEGKGSHADVTAGAQVLIRDGRGKLLAVGELGPGAVQVEASSCSFALTVDGVPIEKALYSLEVAHRGANHYTEKKIKEALTVKVP